MVQCSSLFFQMIPIILFFKTDLSLYLIHRYILVFNFVRVSLGTMVIMLNNFGDQDLHRGHNLSICQVYLMWEQERFVLFFIKLYFCPNSRDIISLDFSSFLLSLCQLLPEKEKKEKSSPFLLSLLRCNNCYFF